MMSLTIAWLSLVSLSNTLSFANGFDARLIFSDTIIVDRPLNAKDESEINKHKIDFVEALLDAPNDLFENGSIFHQLKGVTIECSESVNNRMLHSLAENFSDIRKLTIIQKEPISTDSLTLLKKFKKLQYLGLIGDLAAPQKFSEYCPVDIKEINVTSNTALDWTFPSNLPKLERLSINSVKITSNFLNSIQAPQLNYLYVDSITEDACSALTKFKNLKHLLIMKESVSDTCYQIIQKLRLKELCCGDLSVYPNP